MSKRRIQIRDLQKQEIEEKQERRLLIRLHIFYLLIKELPEDRSVLPKKREDKIKI